MGKPDASEEAVPRSTPHQHALEAMASAARRAREGVVPPGPTPARPTPARPSHPAPVAHASPPIAGRPPPRRISGWSEAKHPAQPTEDLEGLLRAVPIDSQREGPRPDRRPQTTVEGLVRSPQSQSEQRLLVAVFVTAALVAVAAIILVVIAATRHQPSTTTPPAAATGSTTHHHSAAKAASSTTLPTPTPGAAPIISSLSPSSGAAGQAITILGANFMSPSGHISARVGTRLASIACPQQSTCTLTVPPPDPGTTGSVSVTVTTDSGTSNAVSFSYR
jgi:hypothetical protein